MVMMKGTGLISKVRQSSPATDDGLREVLCDSICMKCSYLICSSAPRGSFRSFVLYWIHVL